MELNLALIICTRNRPEMLNNLLNSIQVSELKPDSIIIVSSGVDISEIVETHRKSLKILHHHTHRIGQSNQKMIAIQMLNPTIDWVFFLDDDLELIPSTLTRALQRIELIRQENVSGIGTNLTHKSQNFQHSKQRKFQSQTRIGRIKPSGRALKYAFSEFTYTEWLNGASIWRKDCLNQYMLPVLDSKYAAYEDVIFSSNVARTSKLIYDPSIILLEQLPHSRVTINFKQLKYITIWTGYLVCSRPNMRIYSYKMLTVARFIFFIFPLRRKYKFNLSKMILCLRFLLNILRLPRDKVKSKILLIAMLNSESENIN